MSLSQATLQFCSRSLERQQKRGIQTDRPYNSLTKKRKETIQMVNCHRVWPAREDSKDEFWAAIRSNYDYIMDTNLIDCCKEASGELTWDETDVSTLSWSLKEVSCQFSELYSWLRILQELVYSKEENILDKSLRAAHMEELRRKAYRRKLFNEQAGKLISRTPALKDEVAWRVDHLNAKWELVEQIMAPIDRPTENQQDVSADFEHEVKCLRKWLREMESRLQPLNFHINWTRTELEEKAMEHMILQRDIEAHGRIVSSVVKLSEKVIHQKRREESSQNQQQNDQQRKQERNSSALRVASSLERRWHLLFLRALEWQCHLETLATRVTKSAATGYYSSDEEPVRKQPRLSICSSGNSTGDVHDRLRRRSTRRAEDRSRRLSFSDSEASSENLLTDDGSYFEDELCQLCVMDKDYELPAARQKIENHANIVETAVQYEADIVDGDVSEMPPTPDTASASTLINKIDDICPLESKNDNSLYTNTSPKRRKLVEEAASFNTSNRKSRNCATFYFKHADTDSEADRCVGEDSPGLMEDSSEEEWTYTTSRQDTNDVCIEKRKTNVVCLDFSEVQRTQQLNDTRIVPKIENNEETMLNENNDNERDVNNVRTCDSKTAIDSNNFSKTNYHNKNIDSDNIKRDAIVINFVPSDEQDNLRNQKVDNSRNLDLNKNCESDVRDSDEESHGGRTSTQRLIKEVEKLVRDETANGVPTTISQLIFPEKHIASSHRTKYLRIKEWLRLNSALNQEARSTSHYWLQPLDSCDASGEYTTEDSDAERHSDTSEEPQSSITTYRRCDGTLASTSSQSVSRENFEDVDRTLVGSQLESVTPKVVMRTKPTKNGPRPWSVSCISQIGSNPTSNQCHEAISQFSISETALHQLVSSSPTKYSMLQASESQKLFNNSTSTLLEESITGSDNRVVRNSLLRKKRSRLRRRNLGRKSESSSEGLQQRDSTGSDGSFNLLNSSRRSSSSRKLVKEGRNTLIKSGSFSGCTAPQQLSVERIIVSDPTPLFWPTTKNFIVSNSETEENERIGSKVCHTFDESFPDSVFGGKERSNRQFNVDSDVEMNSLGNNSFSEQAWDNYQEKYMSETYSEAPDVETARRLLEFGDDYRNFLDSQSDCASSMSAMPGSSSPLPRPRKHHVTNYITEDSDSDVDVLRNTVEKSQEQFVIAENLFLKSNDKTSQNYAEIEGACRENIRLLQISVEQRTGSYASKKYAKQIHGIMEKWESLLTRFQEAQKATVLHRDLDVLHSELKGIHDRIVSCDIILDQPQALEEQISRIKTELTALRECKVAMLTLNVSTHRLITDLGTSVSLIFTALKDGVADLYRIWDETFRKGNHQLCALQAVQQFSTKFVDLQCVLQRDKDTLAVLDVALHAGATTEVASSVRHVARLLSEKQDVNSQDVLSKNHVKEELKSESFPESIVLALTGTAAQEGGSLSDSGISDSGSEQELSERERRLATLRRLTRSLENQLPAGSQTLQDLWKRVQDAETELQNLQRHCRDLIVRTAASVDACLVKNSGDSTAHYIEKRIGSSRMSNMDEEKVKHVSHKTKKSVSMKKINSHNEPDNSGNWIWRILRAALPFQLALIALFCAACLLEPHCCEATNTLSLSLTPQLRYIKGPPPV